MTNTISDAAVEAKIFREAVTAARDACAKWYSDRNIRDGYLVYNAVESAIQAADKARGYDMAEPVAMLCTVTGELSHSAVAEVPTETFKLRLPTGRYPLYLRPIAQPKQEREAEATPAAWLHSVVQGDGEPDQALSFKPDDFPFSEILGFRSISHEPLYRAHPPAADDGYKAMFLAAVSSIAQISDALGIDEDEASCANGNELILAAIARKNEALMAAATRGVPPAADERALRTLDALVVRANNAGDASTVEMLESLRAALAGKEGR